MRQSKFLMLGTVISLTALPFSLSAVTFKDVEREVLTTRACYAPKTIGQEGPVAERWMSSLHQTIKHRSSLSTIKYKINSFLFFSI